MRPFLLLLKPSRNTPESLYLVVRLFFDIRHQFPNNQAQQAHDDSSYRARQDVLVHMKVKHRKTKYHPSNGNTKYSRPEQQGAKYDKRNHHKRGGLDGTSHHIRNERDFHK
jgi:hypothetical protein